MVGIDEVGRGSLAGPMLVVAARQKADFPKGIKDSKLLSRLQREVLYNQLVNVCDFGEGWVKASEIDKLGLAAALSLGVKRSLLCLRVSYDEPIVIDGGINYVPPEFNDVQAKVRADQEEPVVSAASIYAKVTRDRYMALLSLRHPKYMFETNVGYGTPGHLGAISDYGALRFVHRMSFRPIRQLRLL